MMLEEELVMGLEQNIEYERRSTLTEIDASEVHILLSMKNAPPAPPKPQSPVPVPKQESSCTNLCKLTSCIVCERGVPNIVLKTPTWSTIMRVVFFALKNCSPEKEFFNLRTDVYNFMQVHWPILCTSKDPTHNWKKQVQDMLSHSKNVFESGSGLYKQNGFWRLKHVEDPWTIDKPQRDRVKGRSNSSGEYERSKRLSDDDRSPGSSEEDTPPVKRQRTRSRDSADEPIIPRLENAEFKLRGEVEQIKLEVRQLHEKMKQMRDRIAHEQLGAESIPLAQLSEELIEMQTVINSGMVGIQQVSKMVVQVVAQPEPVAEKPLPIQATSTFPTKSPLAAMVAQVWPNPIISALTSSVLTPICHYVPQGAASS